MENSNNKLWTFEKFKVVVQECWSRETSLAPEWWTKERPATGQCIGTALLVCDYFGGEMTEEITMIGKKTFHHFANILDGVEVDLTVSQFSGLNVVWGESGSSVPKKPRN